MCISELMGRYPSSAKVVEGTLILSLPDAVSPVVWRMALGEVKASALEVRTEEDGTATLILKTPRGDIQEIAPFAEPRKAVKALMKVSRAMERAHGQIHAGGDAAAPAPKKKHGIGSWLMAIVGVLALLFLLNFIAGNSLRPGLPSQAGPSASSLMQGGASPDTPGVPVSADDFLRSR